MPKFDNITEVNNGSNSNRRHLICFISYIWHRDFLTFGVCYIVCIYLQVTFTHMCDLLTPILQKQTTRFRCPIPVPKRVMVALWRLSTNIEFRTLGHLFGIGRATACVIFHEVIHAIGDVLGPLYLRYNCTCLYSLILFTMMIILLLSKSMSIFERAEESY